MKFLSVCSGIEAASVAWNPLGWEAVAFSEIEPFPCAVLQHHYPNAPNWGDMTKFQEWPNVPIDLLCGGTPCQSFSVAGLRAGLDDPRGDLMLTFGAIAAKYRPRWLVWENVPGVLSSNQGRDFGTLLGMLGELGYGVAYRVLDAQYFGVAQRRRRVFVVGYLGDWRAAAAVLFERHSLSGNPAPSRTTGQSVAANAKSSATSASHWDGVSNPHPTLSQSHNTGGIGASNQEVFSQRGAGLVGHAFRMTAFGEYADDNTASTMKARDYKDATDLVAFGIPGNWIGRKPENGGNSTQAMFELSPTQTATDKHGVIAFNSRQDPVSGDVFGSLDSSSPQAQAIAIQGSIISRKSESGAQGKGYDDTGICFTQTANDIHAVAIGAFKGGQGSTAGGIGFSEHTSPTLTSADSGSNRTPTLLQNTAVRRLTPIECERLQGFPDNYTQIPWKQKPASECPDGHRYKALGNSWAVPCARWIGERINAVEEILHLQA